MCFLSTQVPRTVMISGKRNVFGTNCKMGFDLKILVVLVSLFCLIPSFVLGEQQQNNKLRFGQNGEFKILQVADMHYADGKTTLCLDVLPSQNASCSDLNTTAFIEHMILAEKPNLIVFTGIHSFFLIVAFLFCTFTFSCFKKSTF